MSIVTAANRRSFELLEPCRNDRADRAASDVVVETGGARHFDRGHAVDLPAIEDGLFCRSPLIPSLRPHGDVVEPTRASHGIDEPALIRRTPHPSVPREIVS